MIKLGSLTFFPVPPGHENEPEEPMTALVDQDAGIVYVREADWPAIKAELANLPTRH